MKKAILIPTISLFLICLCSTVLLGFVNSITQEKITQNSIQAETDSRKAVMPQAASFSEKKDGIYTYQEKAESYSYVEALDKENNVIGYVFITQSAGYGGAIDVMTGIMLDGKVYGIDFLEISETVGLGMNATKASFKDQFKGLIKGIGVNKNNAGENEIKALTGATITSQAVAKGVNIALEVFGNVIGGEGNG